MHLLKWKLYQLYYRTKSFAFKMPFNFRVTSDNKENGTKTAGSKNLSQTFELQKELECPVCLSLPREAPIYQCENGHMVCKNCLPKLKECPVCKRPIGKTRCLMAEKVIN